jgi:type IV pilus assembly protein PilC
MPIFRYKALNNKGRSAFGRVIAFNDNDAERKVARKGLQPVWLLDISGRLDTKLWLLLQRVRNKDIVVFSREFSLMVSANIGVVEALMTIQEQTVNPKLKNIISELIFEVEGGAMLSDALERHGSHIFSNFYINVVRAGETSGKLDEVLLYLADEMEKDFDLLSKFRGAMIYPAFVLSGLVAVGFIMMYFVMPQLVQIIQETDFELPWATKVVMGAINFFQNYLFIIIIFIIVSIVLFRMLVRTKAGRAQVDAFKLRIPLFGPLFKLVYLIRFCRSLSTLLLGGVTIIRSLETASEVVRNTVYKTLITDTVKAVNEGHSISYVFATSPYVPGMVPEMMVIGEKTGKLDEVLNKVSDFYARELNAKLNTLNVLIEPIIMVIMGVGVGIMVAAIILPMYNMATSF